MVLPTYTIVPMAQGGPIQITISLLTPQIGSCKVYLWNSAQQVSEIVNPNGGSLEWKFSLPDDPGVYAGGMIDSFLEIVEPAPSPGDTFSVQLVVSQNGSQAMVPYSGTIGSDPVTPRLSIALV